VTSEPFAFNSKEYRVTPEMKKLNENIAELIRTLGELSTRRYESVLDAFEGLLERTDGNISSDDEFRRRLEQVTRQAVAVVGLDSPIADFLSKRS